MRPKKKLLHFRNKHPTLPEDFSTLYNIYDRNYRLINISEYKAHFNVFALPFLYANIEKFIYHFLTKSGEARELGDQSFKNSTATNICASFTGIFR